MMNIEQTKKMNFMIKELTKSGMVSSFEDAVDQASSLYSNSMPYTLQVSQKEEPRQQLETDPKVSDTANYTAQVSPKTDDLDLFERRVHSTIRHNNDSIASEMNKLWQELKSVKSHYQQELEQLRNMMETLKVSRRQEPNAEVQRSLVESSSQKQQASHAAPQQKQAQSKEENHPRQGSFTPNNIDLESYFYFGNK